MKTVAIGFIRLDALMGSQSDAINSSLANNSGHRESVNSISRPPIISTTCQLLPGGHAMCIPLSYFMRKVLVMSHEANVIMSW
jgi:hypothetical protein